MLKKLAFTLACGLLAASAAQAGTCRVTTTGNPANDGSAWDDAHALTLQGALGSAACTEIWVKRGVYKPGAAGTISATFSVNAGVQVFGGFAGTETSQGEADPRAHLTVLSGDIDGNDTTTGGITLTAVDIQGSNSDHVVTMQGATASTVLDGFTVTGGKSLGNGGGLYCHGQGSGNQCSPVLSRLVFSGNSAAWGGAIYNNGSQGGTSSPAISQSTFSGNRATSSGGAIYNNGFLGGTSSPAISQSTFSENSAASHAGAVYNDGYDGGTSNPVISQSTFSGNNANYAGAIYTFGSGAISSATVRQSLLWGNTAAANGSQALTLGADAHIVFDAANLIQGGCAASAVSSGGSSTCNGSEVVTGDPQLGSLQDNGGPTPTRLPGAAGAAVDAFACPASPGTDQRGVLRPQGVRCDLGAVELLQSGTTALTVTISGAGGVSGGSNGVCAPSSPGGCSASYSFTGEPLAALRVPLAATPDPGYHFAGWSGACSSTSGACTVSMDQARNVTAHFTPNSDATYTGTTVPASGAGGPASASFTTADGGPACRFDATATGFVAAGATPPGKAAPQGAFRFKLVGCSHGATVRVTTTWPQPVAEFTKLSQGGFMAPDNLAISGYTVAFDVTDGSAGDDDGAQNGEIVDPVMPLAAPAAGARPIPTLGAWGLLLLSALLGLPGWRRR